jgi:glycosyltransferase involved in cell wall biosynthesis
MQASSDIQFRTNGNGQAAPRKKQRRIALFTGAYNHIEDGVSLTLNRLVAHLEQTGAEVLVFAPSSPNPPIKHNGTLVPVPSVTAPGRPEYRLSFRFPKAVQDRVRAFNPTLFHIATPDYLGYRALRLANSMGVPVVTSFHTHFSSYLKYYKLGAIEDPLWIWGRWFYSRCRQIYVPSLSIAEMLRRRHIETEIRLWPRGVDSSLFHPGKRSLEWRRSLGINDDETVVTFVSRLVWEKGLDVFTNTLQALEEQGVRHRCIVVGDGPARSALESRMPEAIFLGYQRGEDLARSYASSDIFLFPSETETFGNVTLEAMASGLPTVCADASGSDSLVIDGKTGFLVEPGDPVAFTTRVKKLIEDAPLRSEQSRAAYQASMSYSWPNILSRMVHYYDDVIGDTGEPASQAEPIFEAPVVTTKQPVSIGY